MCCLDAQLLCFSDSPDPTLYFLPERNNKEIPEVETLNHLVEMYTI